VLDQLRSEGLEVTGEVGDPNPVGALIDAMMASTPDEVIVATWPRGRSLWWGRDQLPARIRRLVGMPVTHIEVGQKAGRRRSVTGHSTAALVVLGRH
jgi:hypothetical protein